MKVTLEGTPEEIAALVVAAQEQQRSAFDEDSFSATVERYIREGRLSTKNYIPIPRHLRTVTEEPFLDQLTDFG